jgi:type III pantothenate kinase
MTGDHHHKSTTHDLGPRAAELVVIDIGNSSVHLGAAHDGMIADRVVLDAADEEGLPLAIERLWSALDAGVPREVVAASVAPETLRWVADAVERITGQQILVVRDQIDLPIAVEVGNPDTVGVDRVCAAAAAHAQLKRACVVADLGTAITIDCVSDDGVFMGGAILPGLRLSALSLEEHTAALPLVEIVEPTNPWGRDTREAINNGIFFGAVGALREIVERYATEMSKWPDLILTGGAAELIARHANFVDHVVPDLTLRGIALAYYRMFGEPDA